ncbi:MAG TPA: hypothetical protein VGO93_27435 [Candidatus Xenobia bacterium]|jgi:Spy/CpxP family protein refolding chaperone
MSFKQGLIGLSMLALVSGGAFAQAPDGASPPPPPAGPGQHWQHHRMQLTDDQKAHMKALHDQFGQERKADFETFTSEVKGILTPAQLAIWNKHQAERQERQAAFKKGEEQARQILQKNGQPVPKPGDDHGWGMGGPMTMHPAFAMMGGGHEGWQRGGHEGKDGHRRHGHHHGRMFKDLHLTTAQMGEVKVFGESLRMKERTEMQAMMQQMRGIVSPGQAPAQP